MTKILIGNLTGPQGPQGPEGQPGPQGLPGQDGSNVVPTDTAIATNIGTPGTQTREALDGAFGAPTRGPLAGIGKAATGKYRVVLGGTSKAAAGDAPLKSFAYQLQRLFGRSRTVIRTFMLDGGTDLAYLGWIKQHYAGPGFARVRGDSASTVRTFTFYGDTATVYFSRETDATPVDILIDGVVVGQTPAAGAQAFAVKQVFAGLSGTQRHTITVNVPSGAGYVYMERLEFSYAADTGVEILDLTKGGSSLWNMTADWPAVSQGGVKIEADPIPLVAGTSGLASWLETNVDLFIGQWTVNDAGSHNALVTMFEPNWNALADLALTQGQQVISIIETGGHFAAPGDPDHADFLALVNVQRALSPRSHVTVVDFHAATIMDDIVAYAARYFPGASNVNPVAGTWTGDFIHESAAAYGACLAVMCERSGVPVPPATLATAVRSLSLNGGARGPIPRTRSAVVGGVTKNLPEVGATWNPITNTSAPLLSDVGVASSLNTLVTGATTADAFGQYRLTNNDFRGVSLAAGVVYTVTVVSVGNAVVRLDNAHVLDEFGNELPYEDVANKRTSVVVSSPAHPVVWSFQIGAPDGSPGLVMLNPGGVGWRLYGIWITPSSSPVIHPAIASDGLVTAAGQVVNPGTTSFADPAGITLSAGVWMVAVTAVRADNGAHGATATFLVTNGNSRAASQQIGSTVAANALTALALAAPTSNVVRATATANAGGYTVNFTYSATRLAASA